MTFPEYFNELYKYTFNDETRDDFFTSLIQNFIYKEKEDGCKLLTYQSGTKTRYVQENNPRSIDSKQIQYLCINHDSQRFTNWIKAFMDSTDSNDYIETWLEENGEIVKDVAKSCNSLLTKIFYEIAYPEKKEGEIITLPPTNEASSNNIAELTEHDNTLLADFNSDYDEIIQFCISERYAQEYLSGRLQKKINSLYTTKWKNRSNEFNDILLKSDILSVIGTLQMLSDALNPHKELKSGLSVNKIRIKLRDLYVKLHPSGYTDIYPYDAFIDDWNDSEYF